MIAQVNPKSIRKSTAFIMTLISFTKSMLKYLSISRSILLFICVANVLNLEHIVKGGAYVLLKCPVLIYSVLEVF